jgi:trigger factor
MLLRYVKDEAAAAAFAGATNGSRVVFNLLKAYPNETDLAAMLQVSKEVVRALVSDFAFTVGEIRRYKKAEVSQALFDKLYGEGKVNSEAEFREKIRERLEQQYKEHSDYRFNIDAKEKMFRKNEAVPFPDDFFRRWIARVSKDATPKELEEIFPSTKESFEWGFIKQAMQKEYNIQVTEEDARVCARSLAASELRQRGYYYFTAEDLDGYAEQIMKDEQQREKSYNMALDEMVFACIRENVKLDEQDITLDDFQKLFK